MMRGLINLLKSIEMEYKIGDTIPTNVATTYGVIKVSMLVIDKFPNEIYLVYAQQRIGKVQIMYNEVARLMEDLDLKPFIGVKDRPLGNTLLNLMPR
jgi:hypothetical protein